MGHKPIDMRGAVMMIKVAETAKRGVFPTERPAWQKIERVFGS
jgi:hypothetical protein